MALQPDGAGHDLTAPRFGRLGRWNVMGAGRATFGTIRVILVGDDCLWQLLIGMCSGKADRAESRWRSVASIHRFPANAFPIPEVALFEGPSLGWRRMSDNAPLAARAGVRKSPRKETVERDTSVARGVLWDLSAASVADLSAARLRKLWAS